MGDRLEKAKRTIIVALDVKTIEEAEKLIAQLQDEVWGFKIGRQFADSVGTPQAIECVKGFGARLLFDGKIDDIPASVVGDVMALVNQGVEMLNMHTTCGSAAMREAVAAINKLMDSAEAPAEKPLLIGVTALTSLRYEDFVEMGLAEPITGIMKPDELAAEQARRMEKIVSTLAKLAQDSGLDGVIASALEIEAIRAACGDDFVIATPGLRSPWAAKDDQARIRTPAGAMEAGGNFGIHGRAIREAPENMTPVQAANRIAAEIEAVL